MANALCQRCTSLNLSIAKFRIDDKNGDEDNRSPELTRSRSYFGTVTQIRDSAENCELCELIADTVRDANVPHMDDVACHLLWEMDGRTSAKPLFGQKGNKSRRLRVCWSDTRLKSHEAYVMLAAPPKYDKSDVDYPGLLNDETQFLGRRIGSSHNKKNLVREFLRLCETCHDERCTAQLGIEDPFRDTLNEPYFGVIDMENESLVPLPYMDNGNQLRFKPYATVSYVWGNGHSRQHATRVSNIQSRRKSGGLSAVIRDLPKALRQSIALTHQLGIRYIWIDALCIVQNSRHSWNLNARAMHLIYGNSVLTICAADGIDANTGLLALDDNHQTRQMVVNYGPGVCLMLHRPAETSIETTQWNRRAWTFQERLLSKRCLIFTEGRIFFLDLPQRSNGLEANQTEPVQHLCRCEISDQRGDKCGSVVVDSEWLGNKENEQQTLFEFIAISDAKDFTNEEFPDWTYYIPKERIESEWDLYFVLLVEFYPEEGIYRRVALGKVFKAAFTHLVEKEWKEIILG
ncbi:hypothetical protein BFJ72_g233 [Fusarium proliferatum]|uniref:Heterokaryon incompatibility domain-containing protein n=1 Tax=Gibberella intermedia TaxID=948311 RepID=A0A420UAE6_GIBIN|nr:hypothetical protein BFJ72_g233 [Fusarium proliferatum]